MSDDPYKSFDHHIKAQEAEITRLRAACDASEERERAIELRFWQTVDRDGLTGLPSDMWAALEQLVRDRAAIATARREGMEEAAQMAADFETVFYQRTMPANDPHECAARAAREIAAAIRALSDAPSGMVLGQLAKQDLRSPDCIKQWPECESGAYDPRCCRFPKSCSCESGALKGEDND
jgi:hypothetical protein